MDATITSAMRGPAGFVGAAAEGEDPSGGAQSIADTIDSWFSGITEFFGGIIFAPVNIGGHDAPIVVLWSILAAIGFTIYLRFVQFRKPQVSLEVVRGKWSKPTDPGEVSHFQALTSALSATVGLGNIAGVAAAVTLGGPGAAFWMMIAGFFGMCTKFVECTLGVKYRTIDEDGTVHGGPFKYLPVAYRKLGKVPVMVVTGLFAVAILLFGVAGGGMFQANQAFAQVRTVTGGEDGIFGSDLAAFLFGIGIAVLVGLVLIGGIKSIGKITSRLVPAMALMYVAAGLIIIGANITNVPAAFGAILEGAFAPQGIAGGVLGVILIGVQRAAFSNEAGIGSAPIAHGAVKTRRPVSEGFNALLEPFIDTVVICMMTALIIIIADAPSYAAAREGAEIGDVAITSDAFETVLPGFPVLLALAVFLFAFSTIITWAYYGQQAWRHLFGRTSAGDLIFRLIVCGFVVIGCMMSFSNIIDFADAALFMCIFINVIGLVILAPKVKEEMVQYLADRRAGRLLDDPEPLEPERMTSR